MTENQQKILLKSLRLMLRPVMKFCLRHSIKIQEVLESSKVVLLELAVELQEPSKKPSISRLSVMTGIHRRDVMRIYRDDSPKDVIVNLTNRVLGHWQSDPEFTTSAGKPRVLTYKGPDSDFSRLVNSISLDLKQHTVLFELERTGAIEYTAKGIRQSRSVYMPSGDIGEGSLMMATHTEHLMSSIEENIAEEQFLPNYHILTEYDNIATNALPEVREWILREGSKFHKKTRAYLAKFDKDLNPRLATKEGGVRVVVGGFSRVNTVFDTKESKQEET